MTPLRCLFLFLFLSVASMLAASAACADWIVVKASQPARYTVGGEAWRPLTAGMTIPDDAWIHTGRSGRLLLRSATDTIQFKPNVVAALSERLSEGADATTIFQKFGTILIDVDPRHRRTWTVETPFLAVIVKGTRFRVEVDRTSVRVRVVDGIVQVTHPVLGLQAEIGIGQVAIAQGNRRFAVRGARPLPEIVQVEPRPPRVSPATPARVHAPPVREWGSHGPDPAQRRARERSRERAQPAQSDPGDGNGVGPSEGGDDGDKAGGDDGDDSGVPDVDPPAIDVPDVDEQEIEAPETDVPAEAPPDPGEEEGDDEPVDEPLP